LICTLLHDFIENRETNKLPKQCIADLLGEELQIILKLKEFLEVLFDTFHDSMKIAYA
jgi:hypothetical protein